MAKKKLAREDLKYLGLYKAQAQWDCHEVIGYLIYDGFAGMYIAPLEDVQNTPFTYYPDEMVTLHLVKVLEKSVEPYTGG